jgi:hypothetical protein
MRDNKIVPIVFIPFDGLNTFLRYNPISNVFYVFPSSFDDLRKRNGNMLSME